VKFPQEREKRGTPSTRAMAMQFEESISRKQGFKGVNVEVKTLAITKYRKGGGGKQQESDLVHNKKVKPTQLRGLARR